MKSLRILLALTFASALALSVARAGDDKSKEKPAEKATCTMDCKKDKDGKFTCSKDGGKSCCCGAEGKEEKKTEKKEEKK